MKQQVPATIPAHRQMWRRLLLLAAFLLALYVFIPQVTSFSFDRNFFDRVRWGYVGVGVACTVVTYVIAAMIYVVLALRKLQYGQTLLVQTSSAFVNRLLPGGIGILGLFVAYLHRKQHSVAEATVVVAVNNTLGIIGHILLFTTIVAINGAVVSEIRLSRPVEFWLGCLALAAVVIAIMLAIPLVRRVVARVGRSLSQSLTAYRKRPASLAMALGLSLVSSMSYVVVLWACCMALAVDVSFTTVFVVLTVGILAGTVTPTPGGVGGAEAGLAGAFIAYGVSSDAAIAVALLYRLLTYWLPLLPGFVAFLSLQRSTRLFSRT